MALLLHRLCGMKCSPVAASSFRWEFNSCSFTWQKPNHRRRGGSVVKVIVLKAVPLRNAETAERMRLKQMFSEARDRCLAAPTEGVSFTLEDFHAALENFNFLPEIGTKVKGTIFSIDVTGASIDISAKTTAYLPLREASIHNIKRVEDAGMKIGFCEEFLIIGENEEDGSLVLSLRAIQYSLAWERCRQLQAEDIVVKGNVIGAKKGGVVAVIEGLCGFVPFSQLLKKTTAEELLDKGLPLKFVEVDQNRFRLILSNRKAMADGKTQSDVGSVVTGTVQSLKPYGAFIDIGGIKGLLHVSQISHDRVSDIASIFQPGDILKAMILSYDKERGRVSLSTKKLEPTPGDMIRNPEIVFERADEMAHIFRQIISQAEAMADADMLRF